MTGRSPTARRARIVRNTVLLAAAVLVLAAGALVAFGGF